MQDSSVDSKGFPSIDGQACLNNNIQVVDESGVDFAEENGFEYFGLIQHSNNSITNQLQFNQANLVDSSPSEMFLCEKETTWHCPNGYVMYKEFCYKIMESKVSIKFPLWFFIRTEYKFDKRYNSLPH